MWNKDSTPIAAQTTSEGTPYDDSPRVLWCLIEGDTVIRISLAANQRIAILKELIHVKCKISEYARDLVLLKVDIPSDDHNDRTLRQLKVAENEGRVIDSDLEHVSYYWPTQPADGRLHVFVKRPLSCECKQTLNLGDEVSFEIRLSSLLSSPPVTASISDPTLSLDRTWARRTTTVEAIYSILNSERLVQVRGSPGSGKTILLKLLRKHILKVDPSAVVHVIWSWLKDEAPTTYDSRRSARLPRIAGQPGQEEETMEKTYILFDNGQDTYWDTELWENFFKDQQQRRNGYRIVLFCSYGSAGKRMVDYSHGVPGIARPRARISLRPNTLLSDCEPVGLLLNREDFDVVVKRSAVVLLGPDLHDFIFETTDGHVGAVMSVLDALSTLCSEKQRNNVVLTMADFKAMDKSAFWFDVEHHSTFRRGLPTRAELCRIGVANVFRDLLINKAIDRSPKYGEALEWCHKHGFIHSDAFEEQVYYVLPSPLHEAYISWRLMPSDVVIPYDTILDLAIAVICQFSPSQLLAPPRRMRGTADDKPPEAQYQKEFYRGLFKLFGGAFVSPEYGTERGARQGRIDFFIDAKKWGIELVRDGKELYEHASRFEETDAHGVWLPANDMLEYLILDFRRTQPIVTHDIPHLYHVVFENDYMRFKIFDNNLRMLHESGLVGQ